MTHRRLRRLGFSRSFAGEFFGTGGPALRACAALALGAALAAVGLSYKTWNAARDDKQLALARLAAASKAGLPTSFAGRPKPAGSTDDAPAAAANPSDPEGLVSKLNVPWPRLLSALERAALPSISITSMESDAKARRLTITAEAQAMPPLLAFADRLGEAREFGRIALNQHERRGEEEAAMSMRLTLSASWGETPADSGAVR